MPQSDAQIVANEGAHRKPSKLKTSHFNPLPQLRGQLTYHKSLSFAFGKACKSF
jgi:hypothetical protein